MDMDIHVGHARAGQPLRFAQVVYSTGFTLVEMVGTLAIAAILVTAVIPMGTRTVAGNRLVSSVNAFIGALNLARSEAIQRTRRTVICPSSDGRTCLAAGHWHRGWITFVDHDRDRQHDAGEPLLRQHGPLTGIHIVSSRWRRSVTFRSDGATYGSNATFTACSHTAAAPPLTVILSNPGRARIVRGSSPKPPSVCRGLAP